MAQKSAEASLEWCTTPGVTGLIAFIRAKVQACGFQGRTGCPPEFESAVPKMAAGERCVFSTSSSAVHPDDVVFVFTLSLRFSVAVAEFYAL
jgi:hypothetical protein